MSAEPPDGVASRLPRRPGVFPESFPVGRALRRAPTPGDPLPPDETSPSFSVGVVRTSADAAQPQSDSGGEAVKVPFGQVLSMAAGFPPLDAAPPKFKPKARQYPSGNPGGTSEFALFAERLKELIVGGARRAG
jgi:hypothetical protein